MSTGHDVGRHLHRSRKAVIIALLGLATSMLTLGIATPPTAAQDGVSAPGPAADTPAPALIVCGTDSGNTYSTAVGQNGVVFYGGGGNDTFTSTFASGAVFFAGGGNDRFTNEGAASVFFGGDGNDAFDNATASGPAVFFGGNGDDGLFDGVLETLVFFGGPGADTFTSTDIGGTTYLGSATSGFGDDWVAITNGTENFDPVGGSAACGQVCVSKQIEGGSDEDFAITTRLGLTNDLPLDDLALPTAELTDATGVTVPLEAGDAPVCFALPPEAESLTVTEVGADQYSPTVACSQADGAGGENPLTPTDAGIDREVGSTFVLTPTVGTTAQFAHYGEGNTTPGNIDCVVTNTHVSAPPADLTILAPTLIVCGTATDDRYDPGNQDGVVFYGGAGFDFFDDRGSGSGLVFFGGADFDVFASVGSGSGLVFFGGGGGDAFRSSGSGSGLVFFGGGGDDFFDGRGSGSGLVFFGGAGDDNFDSDGSGSRFAGAVETITLDGGDDVLTITDGTGEFTPVGIDAACGVVCVSKSVAGGSLDEFTITTRLGLTNDLPLVDLGLTTGELTDATGVASTLTAVEAGGGEACFALPPEAESVTVTESGAAAHYTPSVTCTQEGVADPLVGVDAVIAGEEGSTFTITPTVGTAAQFAHYGEGNATPGRIDCVVTNDVSAPGPAADTPEPTLIVCGTEGDDEYTPPGDRAGVVFYGGGGPDVFDTEGSATGLVFFGGGSDDVFVGKGSASGLVFFGGGSDDAFVGEGSVSGLVFFGGDGDDRFNSFGSGSGLVFFGGDGLDDSFNGFLAGSSGFAGAVEMILQVGVGDVLTISDGTQEFTPVGIDAACGVVCVSKSVVGGSADAFTITTRLGLTNGLPLVDLADDGLVDGEATTTMQAGDEPVCFALPPEATSVTVTESGAADHYTPSVTCTQEGVGELSGADAGIAGEEGSTFTITPTVGTAAQFAHYGEGNTTPGRIDCVVTNDVSAPGPAADTPPPSLIVCGTEGRDVYTSPDGQDGVVFYGGGDGDRFDNDGSGSGLVFFGGGGGDFFDNAGSGPGLVLFGGTGADSFFSPLGSGSGVVVFGGGDEDFVVRNSGSGLAFFGGGGIDDFFIRDGSGSGFAGAVEKFRGFGAVNVLTITDGTQDFDPVGGSAACGVVCVSKSVAGGSLDEFTITTRLGLINDLPLVDLAAGGLAEGEATTTMRAGDEPVCFALPPEATSVTVTEAPTDHYSPTVVCTQEAVGELAGDGSTFTITPTVGTAAQFAHYGEGNTTPGRIDCIMTNTVVQVEGTLTIDKTVFGGGAPADSFTFDVVGTPAGCTSGTTLVASGGGSVEVTVVDVGNDATDCTYTVTENEAAGCTLVSGNDQETGFDGGVEFFNSCPGTAEVTVAKTVLGAGTPTSDFGFAITGSAGCPSATATIAAPGGSRVVTVADVSTTTGDACTYTVAETDSAGCSMVSGPEAPIAVGQTASFSNVCQGEATITIDKLVVGVQDVVSSFTVTSTVAGCVAAPASLTISGTATADVVVDDVNAAGQDCTYTVTETATSPATYTVDGSASRDVSAPAVIADGGVATLMFTNRQDPGDVVVTLNKTVFGIQDVESVFEITSSQPGCVAAPASVTMIGTATFDVTVADITDDGLAVPCEYTVTETSTDPVSYTADEATQTVSVAAGVDAAVSFTNRQDPSEGEIAIDKLVIGDQGVVSTFAVTSAQPGCVAVPGVVEIAGTGGVVVAVADITDDGLAVPCEYTVAETGTDPAWYAADQASFEAGAGDTVSFVNRQVPTPGSITIDKLVVGDQSVVSSFAVTSAQPGCVAVPGVVEIAGTGGVVVAVPDITNDGLAVPCVYTVTETGTDPAWYAADEASFEAGAGDTVSFVNRQVPTPGSITIDKLVVGNQSVDSFFTVTSAQPGCVAVPGSVVVAGTGAVVVAVADITNDGLAVPCVYTVAETGTDPVWYVADALSFEAGAGDTVSFVNRQDGALDDTNIGGPFSVTGGAAPLGGPGAGDGASDSLDALDPIECGGEFYGTITGSQGPYTVSYVLSGPATIELGSFVVAAPGDYDAPAGFLPYDRVPDDTYTVTFTVVSSSGRIATGSFVALISDDCDDATADAEGGVVQVALPVAVPLGPELGPVIGVDELAFTGRTSLPTATLALWLIGMGFTILGAQRRRRHN